MRQSRTSGSVGASGQRCPEATRLDGMPADSELSRSARPLLSVRQVAKLLGVCRATVYGLCDRRQLPHFRILNAIRIDPRAVKRFLAQVRRRGLPASSLALY